MEENGKVTPGLPPKFQPIISIGTDESGKLLVVGPFHMKEYCVSLLADTIKFAMSVGVPEKVEPKSNILVPGRG